MGGVRECGSRIRFDGNRGVMERKDGGKNRRR